MFSRSRTLLVPVLLLGVVGCGGSAGDDPSDAAVADRNPVDQHSLSISVSAPDDDDLAPAAGHVVEQRRQVSSRRGDVDRLRHAWVVQHDVQKARSIGPPTEQTASSLHRSRSDATPVDGRPRSPMVRVPHALES